MSKLVFLTLSLAVGIFSSASRAGEQQPLFTFDVVAARGTGTESVSLFQLRDGDLLTSGSLFRIHLTPLDASRVTVELVDTEGATTSLAAISNPRDADKIVLPSEDTWYSLDDAPGIETLKLKAVAAGGAYEQVETFRIQHLDSRTMSLPWQAEWRVRGRTRRSSVGYEQNIGVPAIGRGTLAVALAGLRALQGIRSDDSLIVTRGKAAAELYRRAAPGVVLIATYDVELEEFTGFGSGVIISREGRILTNWHVIDGFDWVAVYFKPPFGIGVKVSDWFLADVVRYDTIRDLALLQMGEPPASLTVLELGGLESVEIGADVHAIGHPEGLDWTYTQGVISQYRADYEWDYIDGSSHVASVIQTQTPINPGNSGGPLLEDGGRIIGINSFSAEDGLNFAVAINEIGIFLSSKGSVIPVRETPAEDMFIELEDRNEDGVPDVWFVDRDKNGVADLVLFDEDFDGSFELIVFDDDEDGAIDGKGIDTDGDGGIDFYMFDTDADGEADFYGDDDDQDGEIDRFFE